MKICFCPGSYDPFTKGHMHVVKQASTFFDLVIIGIGTNPAKKRTYPKQLMEEAIRESLIDEKIKNAIVISYEDNTIDAAKRYNAAYIVKGIRNGIDYEYEEKLAEINYKTGGIDTLYIRAGELGKISSTCVKEEIKKGNDITELVPIKIKEMILKN